MFDLPPLPPSWDAWHPIVVHYPIGLLLSAPLMMMLPLVLPKHSHALRLATLVMLVVGVAGLFVAVSTGERAEEFVRGDGALGDVLHRHEEAGESARLVFSIFAVAYAGFTIVPWVVRKPFRHRAIVGAGVALLIAYVVPCLMLANAAHLGGRLVHEFGVQARLATETGVPAAGPEAEPAERQDD